MNRIGLLFGWGLWLVPLAVAAAQGQGTVDGTKHDLGTAQVPVCGQCHTPHNARGPKLWARQPKSGLSALQAMCFSCHDGTVTDKGWFISDTTNYSSHEVEAGKDGEDCDRCHDPHGADWKFLSTSTKNANVCEDCHLGGPSSSHFILASAHPPPFHIDADAVAAGHPPADASWDPYTDDFSGTRLWDMGGTSPGQIIKCLTCHTPHGAVKDSDLNTIEHKGGKAASPLCTNCHR